MCIIRNSNNTAQNRQLPHGKYKELPSVELSCSVRNWDVYVRKQQKSSERKRAVSHTWTVFKSKDDDLEGDMAVSKRHSLHCRYWPYLPAIWRLWVTACFWYPIVEQSCHRMQWQSKDDHFPCYQYNNVELQLNELLGFPIQGVYHTALVPCRIPWKSNQ